MLPAEKQLRAMFKMLIPAASARCVFARPPHKREVCGFRLYYKGTLVREYFSRLGELQDLVPEFREFCQEKRLFREEN